MRPTKAVINLSNLRENYLNIRKHLNQSRIIPVIKADAYGHGAVQVAHELNRIESSPLCFAVAIAEEAIELRKNGIENDILVFDKLSEENLSDLLNFKLIATIADIEGIQTYNSLGSDVKRLLRFAIKLDTGMGRLGFPSYQTSELLRCILVDNPDRIHSTYTHLATSDENDLSFAKLQVERYWGVIKNFTDNNVPVGLTHFSNSGGIHNLKQGEADFVRAGISLYGYYPSRFCKTNIPLLPVMSLISEVATIRYFAVDESVSYGRKFLVNEPTQIASIPLGYADGVSRNLTGKIAVRIHDKIFPQVGTITMDRMMINCGNEKINRMDEVILFGEAVPTADDWASILNTIPYEITCGISKRVPRFYK